MDIDNLCNSQEKETNEISKLNSNECSENYYSCSSEEKSNAELTKIFFEIHSICIDDFFFFKIDNILINKREVEKLLNNGWLSDTVNFT